MTEPERRRLRQLIDQARRLRLDTAEPAWEQLELFLDERLRERECLHCGAQFRARDDRQRFCRQSHRVSFHRKTEKGRATWNAYRLRRYRADREQAA